MASNIYVDLIIKNAGELLTLSSSFKEESGLGMIQKGAVAIKKGRVYWIGKTEEMSGKFSLSRDGREIDATGKVVMPGLIDAHTHLIFAGSRENEFEQRIQGLSYQEIAERGGGSSQRLKRPEILPLMNFFPLAKGDWIGCFPRE